MRVLELEDIHSEAAVITEPPHEAAAGVEELAAQLWHPRRRGQGLRARRRRHRVLWRDQWNQWRRRRVLGFWLFVPYLQLQWQAFHKVVRCWASKNFMTG
ncbi:unnamed protein product, partial [Miscanthus lutarioriparius]